jgi:hypothetical protein
LAFIYGDIDIELSSARPTEQQSATADMQGLLTVEWPTTLPALMAFLQPDLLVDRLIAEINRVANSPYLLAQREQQIARLEEEIDRLQRTEEAIVVSTNAAREPCCLPWVVLGAKVVPSASGRRSGDVASKNVRS